MEVFDLRISLKTTFVRLFVLPFEIPSAPPAIAYLLIHNKVSIGSIFLGKDYRWTTSAYLPWDTEDLQLIGNEVESLYLRFRNDLDFNV